MSTIKSELAKNPIVNNIFLLRVDAIYDLACTKVSGISQEKEYENIQEGGVNDYVRLREKPVSRPKVLEIERYIGEKYLDPLPVGKKLSLPLVLYVSRYINDFDNAKLTFKFVGCTVLEKKYGDLDAERSGLMTEKTRIAYQYVSVDTADNEEIEASWKFDSTGKDYKGSGKRHAQYDKNELRKIEMQELSRKWPEQRSARKI
jgi:hypothetical protein